MFAESGFPKINHTLWFICLYRARCDWYQSAFFMEIVLHLGVHKTASTYLQTLLEKNIVPLERHCIGYAHPKTLRPLFARAPRKQHATQRAMRKNARAWALQQVIETARDLQRKRLIISEEQLLGSIRALFSGRGLYRDVARELRCVVSALDGQPVNLLLAVRSYDTFFISAYGQVLTGWKYLPFSQKLRTDLLQEPRGWPDIVADIMRVLPTGSTLKIWQYERFRLEETDILQAFVGDAAAQELVPLNTRVGYGPSQKGVQALEGLVADGVEPDVEQSRSVLRTYGKDKGYPGYFPWSPTEQAALQERYARDIALIRNLWPGAFISGLDPMETGTPAALQGWRPSPRPQQNTSLRSNLQRKLTYRRPISDLF